MGKRSEETFFQRIFIIIIIIFLIVVDFVIHWNETAMGYILYIKVVYTWCVSHSVVSDFLLSHGLQPPGSSVHGILQARILEWVAMTPPGDRPNSGIKPKTPALQAESLPSESLGKLI